MSKKKKMKSVSLPARQSKTRQFTIQLPIGSESLHINKAVIVGLFQEHCNLQISDFSVVSDEKSESVVLEFAPQEA